jgi:hypothetical protein
MNALKTLVWIEWMKTSSKVVTLFTLLFVGILLIGLRDVTHMGILGQVAILSVLGMIGIGLVSYLSFQIGDDFRSDRFQTLRLSPVSPWIHLLARVGFQLSIASGYYFILASLNYLAMKSFLAGSEWRMAVILFSYTAYFLLSVVLPGLILILLASMIMTSFGMRSKGKKLAMIILAISSSFWFLDVLGLAQRISGTYFPKIELHLPDSMVRAAADEPIFNSMKFNGVSGKVMNTPPSGGGSGDILMPLDGSLPIYFEPLLLSLVISALGLALTTRIWTEVEL